jgi:hypothetical protein
MKRMIMGCETDAEDGWRRQVSPLPHNHIRCAGGEYSVDIKVPNVIEDHLSRLVMGWSR